jgi:hypothetical protein
MEKDEGWVIQKGCTENRLVSLFWSSGHSIMISGWFVQHDTHDMALANGIFILHSQYSDRCRLFFISFHMSDTLMLFRLSYAPLTTLSAFLVPL